MFECLAVGNGTIKRYSLTGVGVALLEEVIDVREDCEVSYAQKFPSVAYSLLQLPEDPNIELKDLLAPCLPACCHAFHHEDNGLNH